MVSVTDAVPEDRNHPQWKMGHAQAMFDAGIYFGAVLAHFGVDRVELTSELLEEATRGPIARHIDPLTRSVTIYRMYSTTQDREDQMDQCPIHDQRVIDECVAKGVSTGVLRSLQDQCRQDSDRWFPGPGVQSVMHHALALGGEVGEVQNVVKKVTRGSLSHEEAGPMLEDELADVFVYLLNLAGLLGFDLEDAYHRKREYNSERFGIRISTDSTESASGSDLRADA